MNQEENKNPELQPEHQSEIEPKEEERTLAPESNPSGDDPLDTLSEDELRSEAKKFRAIATRGQKKPPEPAPAKEPVAVKDSLYMTRDDFYRSNEKKAIRLATAVEEGDPLRELKEEINANWDSVKNYYAPRHGRDTPEDILEDIFDAHAVFKRREGTPKEKSNPAADLATIGVSSPSGSPSKSAPKSEDTDPRFKEPTKPENWYG